MTARNVLRLLAVAVGAAIFGITGGWILRLTWFAPPPPPPEVYLVAVTDLEPGGKITNLDTQFRPQEFEPGTAPYKAISVEDARTKPESLLGKIFVRPLARGVAVTRRHLKDDVAAVELLKPGERAMSIPVHLMMDDLVALGDRVDLIANYNEGQRSKVLIQDAPVLQVSGPTTHARKEMLLTLGIKARDAEIIRWAIEPQTNFITVALRRPRDHTIVKTEGVGKREQKPDRD
jgi:Flp pilus assembly protein CpaB